MASSSGHGANDNLMYLALESPGKSPGTRTQGDCKQCRFRVSELQVVEWLRQEFNSSGRGSISRSGKTICISFPVSLLDNLSGSTLPSAGIARRSPTISQRFTALAIGISIEGSNPVMPTNPSAAGESRNPVGMPSGDVVCFGFLTYCLLMLVDDLPPKNGGALVVGSVETVGDDAAIVACILSGWGVPTRLVSTPVGADHYGGIVLEHLKSWGVDTAERVSQGLATPLEVGILDATGGRTYFQRREPCGPGQVGSANTHQPCRGRTALR